jgi:hypothetical protein
MCCVIIYGRFVQRILETRVGLRLKLGEGAGVRLPSYKIVELGNTDWT